MACRYVEKAQLIRARGIIGARGLNRIAGIDKVDEIDALDDTPVMHVEAGNDTHLQHETTPSSARTSAGDNARHKARALKWPRQCRYRRPR